MNLSGAHAICNICKQEPCDCKVTLTSNPTNKKPDKKLKYPDLLYCHYNGNTHVSPLLSPRTKQQQDDDSSEYDLCLLKIAPISQQAFKDWLEIQKRTNYNNYDIFCAAASSNCQVMFITSRPDRGFQFPTHTQETFTHMDIATDYSQNPAPGVMVQCDDMNLMPESLLDTIMHASLYINTGQYTAKSVLSQVAHLQSSAIPASVLYFNLEFIKILINLAVIREAETEPCHLTPLLNLAVQGFYPALLYAIRALNKSRHITERCYREYERANQGCLDSLEIKISNLLQQSIPKMKGDSREEAVTYLKTGIIKKRAATTVAEHPAAHNVHNSPTDLITKLIYGDSQKKTSDMNDLARENKLADEEITHVILKCIKKLAPYNVYRDYQICSLLYPENEKLAKSFYSWLCPLIDIVSPVAVSNFNCFPQSQLLLQLFCLLAAPKTSLASLVRVLDAKPDYNAELVKWFYGLPHLFTLTTESQLLTDAVNNIDSCLRRQLISPPTEYPETTVFTAPEDSQNPLTWYLKLGENLNEFRRWKTDFPNTLDVMEGLVCQGFYHFGLISLELAAYHDRLPYTRTSGKLVLKDEVSMLRHLDMISTLMRGCVEQATEVVRTLIPLCLQDKSKTLLYKRGTQLKEFLEKAPRKTDADLNQYALKGYTTETLSKKKTCEQQISPYSSPSIKSCIDRIKKLTQSTSSEDADITKALAIQKQQLMKKATDKDLERALQHLTDTQMPPPFVALKPQPLRRRYEQQPETLECIYRGPLLAIERESDARVLELLLDIFKERHLLCSSSFILWHYITLSVFFFPPDLSHIKAVFFEKKTLIPITPHTKRLFFRAENENFQAIALLNKKAYIGLTADGCTENYLQQISPSSTNPILLFARFVDAILLSAYKYQQPDATPYHVLLPILQIAERGYVPALSLLKQMIDKTYQFLPTSQWKKIQQSTNIKRRIAALDNIFRAEELLDTSNTKLLSTSNTFDSKPEEHSQPEAITKTTPLSQPRAQTSKGKRLKVTGATPVNSKPDLTNRCHILLAKDNQGTLLTHDEMKQLNEIYRISTDQKLGDNKYQVSWIIHGCREHTDFIRCLTHYLVLHLNPGNIQKGAGHLKKLLANRNKEIMLQALDSSQRDSIVLSSGLLIASCMLSSPEHTNDIQHLIRHRSNLQAVLLTTIESIKELKFTSRTFPQKDKWHKLVVFLAQEISQTPDQFVTYMLEEDKKTSIPYMTQWINESCQQQPHIAGFGKGMKTKLLSIQQRLSPAVKETCKPKAEKKHVKNKKRPHQPSAESESSPHSVILPPRSEPPPKSDSSKEQSAPLDCHICFYEYTEEGDNCPRTLPCGHEFCTGCLIKILKPSAVCPICKHEAFKNIKAVTELPKAFRVIDLLKYLKALR